MSNSDQLFVSTSLSPAAVAARIAEVVGGEPQVDEDGVFLAVPLDGSDLSIGGDLGANPFHPVPDPEPDEVSVIDGYDVQWDLRAWTPHARGVRRLGDEQRLPLSCKLFADLATAVPWPMILVHDLSLLVLASGPGDGVVRLPDDTSPDGEHRHLWTPFTVERHTASG